MWKVFKYTVYDLLRSKWTFAYALFYFALTVFLFAFSSSVTKVVVGLMNTILLLAPLVSTFFTVSYYYNSKDFVLFLLAQPLKRTDIIRGMLLGLTASLGIAVLVGIGMPFAYMSLTQGSSIASYAFLLVIGVILSSVFSFIVYWIALRFDDKLKGIGISLLVWLFFAVIYDAIFLLLLIYLRDYPIEKLAIALTLLNPIDLSRVFILLQLDISALFGLTGASVKAFLGSTTGSIATFVALLLWMLLSYISITVMAKKKDF
ncbi:MAG: membrane protein [Thermonema sp.]|uniref:ABC transporter permease n=1 Tax=Thermonema sp. TaxID=2231181 RepID=UPI0021DDF762|nr:ABC transporter permease [Thermonema sp.]GIV39752.1 MAG: membrane protein [Thermonema sp.]